MTTLTDVFPCFFLSCKANATVKPAGARPALFLIFVLFYVFLCSTYFCVVLCIDCFVTFSVLFVCICVLNYFHRVATQLQLNISYHIISYHIVSYIVSYHIISYHTISYHIISYHIISYHIISYHIISYHIISYHIVLYIVSYIVSYLRLNQISHAWRRDPAGWKISVLLNPLLSSPTL